MMKSRYTCKLSSLHLLPKVLKHRITVCKLLCRLFNSVKNYMYLLLKHTSCQIQYIEYSSPSHCIVSLLMYQNFHLLLEQSGERVRIAYEKKQMQLRNQDVKGEEPSVVDKTGVAIRDLYTQLQVSIHSAEAVSKRIEALRDEELQPQLLELVQGYTTHLPALIL